MANRRMFSRDVCESDAFLDLPATSQRLYFFLGLFADDEGFLKNPKSVIRQVNSSVDDLKILVMKGFVIPFDSGVIVIKHWKLNNYLQSDRIKPTTCTREKAILRINSAKEYEKIEEGKTVYTSCIQTGYMMDTQYSVEEYRVGEGEKPATSAPAKNPCSMSERIANHQHAEHMIRRYDLPDNDPTMDAILEDAEKHGWEKLEEALQTAALNNSRQKISVVFYRSILNAEPRKEQKNVRADPYASFERF